MGEQLLREAVGSRVDNPEASYTVRDGFFIDEVIIETAIRLEMDYIVLSKHRRDRWKQHLEAILDLEWDPEEFIPDKMGIEIDVVTEPETDRSTP